MIHGDADGEICILNCFLWQSLALGSHDDCQPFLLFQDGFGEGNALVGEGHGGSTEAKVSELAIVVYPCPWYKKHCSHRNTY